MTLSPPNRGVPSGPKSDGAYPPPTLERPSQYSRENDSPPFLVEKVQLKYFLFSPRRTKVLFCPLYITNQYAFPKPLPFIFSRSDSPPLPAKNPSHFPQVAAQPLATLLEVFAPASPARVYLKFNAWRLTMPSILNPRTKLQQEAMTPAHEYDDRPSPFFSRSLVSY